MNTVLLDELVTEFETIYTERVEAPTLAEITGWADDLHTEFSLSDEDREQLYLRLRTIGHITADDIDNADDREVAYLATGTGVRRKDMTPAEKRAHDNATAQRRMNSYRKRQRKDADNKVREAKPLDPVRMKFSLEACALMMPLIEKVVLARYQKVRRVLGDVQVGDIASETTIGLAEGLARSDHRVESLIVASEWLSRQPGIPEVPIEAPLGAKFIMSVLMRQTMLKIVDNYRANTVTIEEMEYVHQDDGTWLYMPVVRDVTFLSLEYLDTVLSNQFMGGIDSLIANTKADGQLGMVGTKFQIPGKTNKTFARQIIDAAITARGLDRVTDLFLDDDNVRSDGTFKWADHADTIIEILLQADPSKMGSDIIRRELARKAVKEAYRYLLDVIRVARALASDPLVLAEVTNGRHHGLAYITAVADKAERIDDMDLPGARHWQYRSVATLEEIVALTDNPDRLMREKARYAALAVEDILG